MSATPARTVIVTKDRRYGEHYTARLYVGGLKTARRLRGSRWFIEERIPRLLGQEG